MLSQAVHRCLEPDGLDISVTHPRKHRVRHQRYAAHAGVLLRRRVFEEVIPGSMVLNNGSHAYEALLTGVEAAAAGPFPSADRKPNILAAHVKASQCPLIVSLVAD